jgi:hypothetical protein
MRGWTRAESICLPAGGKPHEGPEGRPQGGPTRPAEWAWGTEPPQGPARAATPGLAWARWSGAGNRVWRRGTRPAGVDQAGSWAHQQSFSGDDAYRALDTIERLLGAISAPQAGELAKGKEDLLRQRLSGQARKSAARIEGDPASGLKPWREVITPHPDVASGNFVQAEFAADLWQVYLGEGSSEYKEPAEFFRAPTSPRA